MVLQHVLFVLQVRTAAVILTEDAVTYVSLSLRTAFAVSVRHRSFSALTEALAQVAHTEAYPI